MTDHYRIAAMTAHMLMEAAVDDEAAVFSAQLGQLRATLALVDELRAIRETLTPKPVVTITRTPCQCVTGADEPWA